VGKGGVGGCGVVNRKKKKKKQTKKQTTKINIESEKGIPQQRKKEKYLLEDNLHPKMPGGVPESRSCGMGKRWGGGAWHLQGRSV